jgi:hypothetical protein
MNQMDSMGKLMLIAGGVIMLLGLIFLFNDKIPFLGKMPGDYSYKGKNFSFYFPFVTSIILSIVISLILYVIRRFF